MTYICYRGIEVSARLQYVLLGIEVVVLVVFAVVALVEGLHRQRARPGSLTPSLSWFWPAGLRLGTVDRHGDRCIAVFIYWGWDTAVAVNEETDDPAATPGRPRSSRPSCCWSPTPSSSIAAVAFAGVGTTGIGLGNPDNADDVFAAIGPAVFGDGVVGPGVRAPADHLGADLGVGVHPDDDPADRPHHAVDGRLPGDPGVVRPDPPALPHADGVDDLDGRASRSLFYVGLTLVSDERAGGHDRRGRPADRVLLRPDRLRLRLVLPARPASTRARRPHAGRAARCSAACSCSAPSSTASTYADPDYGYTSIGGVGGVFVHRHRVARAGRRPDARLQAIAPEYFRGETLRPWPDDLPPGHADPVVQASEEALGP